MNEILLHCLQTILSAGLFILIYRLFVRNSNAYNWNRCYLLFTMILSLFLPFIDISSWFTVDKPIIFYASMADLNQVITKIDLNQMLTTGSPEQHVQNSYNVSDLIMIGYWLIVGLFLLRFGWGILRIINMARSNNYSRSGNLRLYPIQRKTTFSFFNYIFIQPEHWEKPAIDYIIRHEQAHVNQLHSIDNILAEIILVFGWFNPFYYIYRRDLHLLHECQADQAVINSGCDKTTYHQMLLNEVSGNLTYIIVNQFSYSLIKRRFKMISKNKQSRLAGFRILLAIPTAFALLLMFSFTSLEKTTSLIHNNLLQPAIQTAQSSLGNFQNHQQKPTEKKTTKSTPLKKTQETKIGRFTPPIVVSDDDTVLTNKVDINAHYPGGYKAWIVLLNNNFKFPNGSQEKSMRSMVWVQFTISESGEIKNPIIIRSVDKACDKEALRVVRMMPKWKPVIKNGKPVSVKYQLPVNYQIPFKVKTAAQSKKTTSVDNEEKPLLVV